MSNPAYFPTADDMTLLQNINLNLAGNLGQIIAQIREVTDAPIVLYTIYNPFYGADPKTAPLLGGINGIIASYGTISTIKCIQRPILVDRFYFFRYPFKSMLNNGTEC
jgi:hypothetical protein